MSNGGPAGPDGRIVDILLIAPDGRASGGELTDLLLRYIRGARAQP